MKVKLIILLIMVFFISTIGIASKVSTVSVDAKSFYSSTTEGTDIKAFPKSVASSDELNIDKSNALLRYFGTDKSNLLGQLSKELTSSRGKFADINVLNETTWNFNSTIGRSDSPILVEVFQDIKCGMCRYAFNNIITILKEKYLKTNKIRLVFKEYPLIERPLEMSLAVAAKCAGTQNKYEDYLAKLYKEGSKPTEDSILSIAKELGLEILKFKTCLESKQALAMVKQDRAEAIKLGVDGTPTFFINGKILVGAQPIESFSKVIENEPAFK